MKPFALQLYERFVADESVAQLAATLGIPVERVVTRVRAAERYVWRHDTARRLAEGAAILASPGVDGGAQEREIVERELRDLERDALGDPGALERLLVPVPLRRRGRCSDIGGGGGN